MENRSEATTCLNDFDFGPTVRGCRDDFDFTQFFERAVLWSLPSAVFILAALLRLLYIYRKPKVVLAARLQQVKCASIAVYAGLQLSLLVASLRLADSPIRPWTVAGSSLSFTAGILMLLISFADHARSVRSSALLNTYLFFTLLFDAAQTRTLWLIDNASGSRSSFASQFTASLAIKASIFLLELYNKSRWIDSSVRLRYGNEAMSNIFNLGTFFWLKDLLWDGFRRVLSLEDLYPINPTIRAEATSARLKDALASHKGKLEGNALVFALARAYKYELLLPVIPRAAKVGFMYAQSFLMQSLIRYLNVLENDPTQTSRNTGYGLIGATALIYFGTAASNAYRMYYVAKLASVWRAGLCALVYETVTKLPASNGADAAPLTLMTTDIAMIQNGVRNIHEIWGNLMQVAIGCWLLYTEIGASFSVPVVVAISCALASGLLLPFITKRQGTWMGKIEFRVGITSKVLANMKSFKMLGVTKHIGKMLDSIRDDEVKAGISARFFLILLLSAAQFPLIMAAAITFLFARSSLNSDNLLGVLSYILLVCSPLDFVIQALQGMVESAVSLRRVQKFLASARENVHPAAEIDSLGEGSSSVSLSTLDSPDVVFRATEWSVGWTEDKMVLSDVNLIIKRDTFTVVTGNVASGKSTLCKAILGEIPVFKGTASSVLGRHTVGYCAQSPFLWNGTIQDNIVGFSTFNQAKYDAVLEATMLNIDVEALPRGSETNVGNAGIALSGGQRMRVSLARALYADASVFLLDDIFSGLDAGTERQVFARTLGPNGIIRRSNATAILFTHSKAYAHAADQVVVLGEGKIDEQGPPHTLRLPVTNSSGLSSAESDSDTADAAAEIQAAAAAARPANNGLASKTLTAASDASRKMGDKTLYAHYFRTIGTVSLTLFFLTSAIVAVSEAISPLWVGYWSKDQFHLPWFSYGGIFTAICAVNLILLLAAFFIIAMAGAPRTARILHAEAVKTVLQAPLQLFSETNVGTITNLFSQDMSLVDMDLPLNMVNFVMLFMMVVGTLFVVAAPKPMLAATYPFLCGILYALQVGYLRTSRQLRLLDLEAKAPLYDQFLETTSGITTIRSLGWVSKSIEKNHAILNDSQRPAYLLSMAQSCLTAALSMIVAIIATLVMTLATQLEANSGLSGASFIALLNLSGGLSALMSNYTDLEIALGGISRLRNFSLSNPPEKNVEDGTGVLPEPSWPEKGSIEVAHVSAAYKTSSTDSEAPPVLKDVTLRVKAGERVALCGRTGSGKSSLLLLLLTLLEPQASATHTIKIDGISLEDINKEVLRQRIITVPQDPCFLPSGRTIKENLDIEGLGTEEECIAALEKAGLSAILEDGINTTFSPEDMSHGQQQLFSFARAILKKTVRARTVGAQGIMFLDEPNSKIDDETDRVMQELIADEFVGYTIVMISHRLQMVMSLCDRVVVLDKGKVVEEGTPRGLVKVNGGWFKSLWEQQN